MKKRRAPRTAFQKGKSGNPGGFSKKRRAERAEILAILQQHGEFLARALIASALRGNVVAQKTALAYVLGPPPEAPVPDAAQLAREFVVRVEIPDAATPTPA